MGLFDQELTENIWPSYSIPGEVSDETMDFLERRGVVVAPLTLTELELADAPKAQSKALALTGRIPEPTSYAKNLSPKKFSPYNILSDITPAQSREPAVPTLEYHKFWSESKLATPQGTSSQNTSTQNMSTQGGAPGPFVPPDLEVSPAPPKLIGFPGELDFAYFQVPPLEGVSAVYRERARTLMDDFSRALSLGEFFNEPERSMLVLFAHPLGSILRVAEKFKETLGRVNRKVTAFWGLYTSCLGLVDKLRLCSGEWKGEGRESFLSEKNPLFSILKTLAKMRELILEMENEDSF
jgi:hypothetical protein